MADITSTLQSRRDDLAAIAPTRDGWVDVKEWHTRTRPFIAEHLPNHLDAFDQLIKVTWTSFPRVISFGPGPPADNSRADAAERASNEKCAQQGHARLLAFMDALIELDDMAEPVGPDTTESNLVFHEIYELIDGSFLAEQYKRVVTADLRQAQMSYGAGAFKSCVVMLGAALEGVMLGTLQRPDVVAHLAASGDPPGPIRSIGARDPTLADKIGNELTFEDYKVCVHNVVTGSDALGVDDIQSFRNAIHPWKTIQEPLVYGDFDMARAIHYLGSLKKIVDAVAQWTPDSDADSS